MELFRKKVGIFRTHCSSIFLVAVRLAVIYTAASVTTVSTFHVAVKGLRHQYEYHCTTTITTSEPFSHDNLVKCCVTTTVKTTSQPLRHV